MIFLVDRKLSHSLTTSFKEQAKCWSEVEGIVLWAYFFPCLHLCDRVEELNVIAGLPGRLTLENYLPATDPLPALIFIFMAGLFGFLPSSCISAATKVSWGNKESVIVSIGFTV